MKTKLTQKQIRFQALLLFFITFFLVELCAVFLYQNQVKADIRNPLRYLLITE